MFKYPKVIRDGEPSDFLAFYCCDPDFNSAFEKVIQDLGGTKHDPYARPAPSIRLAEDLDALKEITDLHELHRFGKIVLLDHVNCGGFGIPDEQEEIKRHFEYFEKCKDIVNKSLPGVVLKTHLLGWEGEITEPMA